MKLIVAEVLIELVTPITFGHVFLKPEGTTYYPDARVYVRTQSNTPRRRFTKYSVSEFDVDSRFKTK